MPSATWNMIIYARTIWQIQESNGPTPIDPRCEATFIARNRVFLRDSQSSYEYIVSA